MAISHRALCVCASLTIVWLFVAGRASAQGQTRPNVVLFFVDDMGWADWERSAQNPHGSDLYETPNLTRLARSGVVLDNGYASSPVCSPTRVSLMTGLSAASHRTTDFIGAGAANVRGVRPPTGWSQNLGANEVTLAEAFQADGYRTGFFGKWHLGQGGTQSANPLANGYDTNVGGTTSGNPGFAGGFFAGSDGAWAGMPGLDTPGSYPSDAYLSDALSEQAADFVGASAAVGEPFFLTLSHYVVHTPIQAPAALVSKYETKIDTLQNKGVDLGGQDNATYAAMVEKMDQSVGRLLDRLADPNGDQDTSDSIVDSTVVVFTADNGGLLNSGVTTNRPLREGKGSIYEGGIREPYIVSWPGDPRVGAGLVNSTPVVTHDLYPTLLDLAGVAGDAGQNSRMDGVSFAPALSGDVLERKPIVWHYPHVSPQDGANGSGPVVGGQYASAVRSGDWKLVWFHEQARYELYDLASDLGETTNVLMNNPAVALDLSVDLRRGLAESEAQMPEGTFGSRGRLPLEAPPLAVLERPIPLDNFAVAHDFKADGVAGTAWDGVLNAGTATAIVASGGELRLASAGATLLPAGFNAPVLYKEQSGDFDARLEIGQTTSVDFHVLAIIALDDSGESVWAGQQNRSGENDFAQSRSQTGAGREDQTLAGVYEHLRLVRDGSEFRGYVSEDGLFWRQFASFDRPDLPDSLRVGLTHAAFSRAAVAATIDSFTLTPLRALPGDFNDDGVVDAADYTLWRDRLGVEFTASDYDVWRAHFGQSSAESQALRTAPEPTQLLLISVGLLLRGLRIR